LFSILTDSLNDWKSIHLRILSVSVYLILRLLNISFESSRDILTSLRMLNIQICHAWATTIIDEGNLCVILRDERGSYKRIPFYENFPEILNEAKSYALIEMCRKECTFDAMSLAIFLDKRFRELYPEIEIEPESLVRSVESCRVDLLKWGAKYDSNKNRPYFEGHEREDVLLARQKFIEHLINLKDFYYVPKKDIVYSWISPMSKKRILISNDE